MPSEAKVVLISGGRSGIGQAIAQKLCGNPRYICIVTSRQFDPKLQAISPQQYHGYLDLEYPDSIQALANQIQEGFGSLAALINNAGMGVFGPLEMLSISDIQATIATNLTGPLLLTQACLPLLKRGSRIVNLGSIVGQWPAPDNLVYGPTKAALKWFSDLCNLEYAPRGILSSCVVLGAVYSDIWKDRPHFDPSEMLDISVVAETVRYILDAPAQARFDNISLYPPKGLL